jgi:4-hydroxybutyrate CoA-transferase
VPQADDPKWRRTHHPTFRIALVISTAASGEPTTLLRALATAAPGHGWTLGSGLLFGEYPFLPAVEAGALRYRTWHVMRPIRDLTAAGRVDYVPARASAVGPMLGGLRIRAALVRVSPPDNRGRCSFGGSTSYAHGPLRRPSW